MAHELSGPIAELEKISRKLDKIKCDLPEKNRAPIALIAAQLYEAIEEMYEERSVFFKKQILEDQ